jgi:two-component system, NtrC family, nitrogen regulation sensor histidine kinase NtrY
MLRRVLVNLVRNAVEAIRDARPDARDGQPRGHVVVRAQPEESGVAVMIADDGPGVPDAARERVFDPYFTSKPEGTGLGLAIVKKIVIEHNGSISAGRSDRLGGAEFVVFLPKPPRHGISAVGAAGEGEARDAAPHARRQSA